MCAILSSPAASAREGGRGRNPVADAAPGNFLWKTSLNAGAASGMKAEWESDQRQGPVPRRQQGEKGPLAQQVRAQS
jgi:hypothetical protein